MVICARQTPFNFPALPTQLLFPLALHHPSTFTVLQHLPSPDLLSQGMGPALTLDVWPDVGVKGTKVTFPCASVEGVNGSHLVVPDSVTSDSTNLLVKLGPMVVKNVTVIEGVIIGSPVNLG